MRAFWKRCDLLQERFAAPLLRQQQPVVAVQHREKRIGLKQTNKQTNKRFLIRNVHFVYPRVTFRFFLKHFGIYHRSWQLLKHVCVCYCYSTEMMLEKMENAGTSR